MHVRKPRILPAIVATVADRALVFALAPSDSGEAATFLDGARVGLLGPLFALRVRRCLRDAGPALRSHAEVAHACLRAASGETPSITHSRHRLDPLPVAWQRPSSSR